MLPRLVSLLSIELLRMRAPMFLKTIGNSRRRRRRRIIYRLDVVVLPLALYIHHNQMPHVSNPHPKVTDILEESNFGQKYSDLDRPTHPWNMLDSA